MLKIRVASLPDSGLDLDEKLPVSGVNKRLSDAPDSGNNKIEFIDPIKVRLHIERVPHGMTAIGEISAECKQICSQCADFLPHPVNCTVNHVFKHHSSPDTAIPEDDIGVSYYRGEHIEMATVLEDLLILSLSPYWHPETDACGNCLICKQNLKNLRKTVKLGTQGLSEALKKAGIV